jgi:membrane dipeptidase
MQIDWTTIRTGAADALHGMPVEVTGWMIPLAPSEATADYALLAAEAPCCGSCVPRDPLGCIEVYLTAPAALQERAICLRGRLLRLHDDPAGWRYQLVEASPIALAPAAAGMISRRVLLACGAALGLAACTAGRFGGYTQAREPSAASSASTMPAATASWTRTPNALTIDMHSHGGRVIMSRDPAIGADWPFLPLAAPMHAGGMNVICLAIVTDTTVTRVSADRMRFEAWRSPEEGELYALGIAEFARAHQLIEREQMHVVIDAASLAARGGAGPCAIIAAEGADFLEGRLERVDEAYAMHQLRHLQLTHYRVNELGDIQTEAPVHGGLTDFGAEVVRRCNARGIVVDVAHGTYALVKRAAATTTRPLVISHSALAAHPGARSRLITPDHARVIAGTGGVIGVWPNSGTFRDLRAMAEGIKRMADVVGVEHVGLGTDMLGFISPPVFRSYEQLPSLAAGLLAAGFTHEEAGGILGGNYRRVFEASAG